MLAGIYYGAQLWRLDTAIPGSTCRARPGAVVTCIDGYQMARAGRAWPGAGRFAAIGRSFGRPRSALLIALFGPQHPDIALKFARPEYFS